LMLGRPQMTTKEALQAYNSITRAVFCKENRKPAYRDGTFKAKILEDKIKDVVKEQELGDLMLYRLGENDLGKPLCVPCQLRIWHIQGISVHIESVRVSVRIV
jgi:hypothetical protein